MTTPHDEEHRPHGGGLRGAVNELFGRGDRDDTRDDEHLRHEGENVRSENADPAYADDPAVAREPGQAQYAGDAGQEQSGGRVGDEQAAAETMPQGNYGSAPAQGQYADEGVAGQSYRDDTYGDGVRGDGLHGDTGTAEQVRDGGDPTAQGQVQHGGEYRGDPDMPSQVQFDGGQPQGTRDARDDVRDDVRGGTRDDVHDDTRGDLPDHVRDDLAAGEPGTASGAGTADTAPAATASASDRVQDTRDAGATAAGRHETAMGSSDNDDEGRAALVAPDRAESYGTRWDSVKGEFVDEPRRAVADADALVGELLDELQELFRAQRAEIEHGLDNDEASTEDLRVALRRYRSFFDRLLSI